MNRHEYHLVKHYIKSLCLDSIHDLSRRLNLNNYESQLLEYLNRGDSRVAISLSLSSCETKISKDSRKVLTKVFDYIKRNNLIK